MWDKKLGCLCSGGKVRSRATGLNSGGAGGSVGESCRLFHCLVRKQSKASHRLTKWSFKRRREAGPDSLLVCVRDFLYPVLARIIFPVMSGEAHSAP